MLFKWCLHEVKALFDSQVYLKNPQAPENATARQQSMILDRINCVVNGQSVHSRQSTSATTSNTSFNSSSTTSTTNNNAGTPSPVAADGSNEKKKRVSPTVAMAEASLLSQKAAMKEATNFEALISLQQEELSLYKESGKQELLEKQLGYKEQKTPTLMTQKIVEKLCLEDDPTERFASRKQKLDDLCEVLGEDMYQAKLHQQR
jgi:hypothetical protein